MDSPDSTLDIKSEFKSKTARSLNEIIDQLGPLSKVSYEPFQPESQRSAKANLPPSFPKNPHPLDYFTLFFTPDLFRTISANTNRYATIQKLQVPQEKAREWRDLVEEELYVFLGAIIYMGVHEEPQVEMYWNTDFNKGPLHSIPNHISLNRFEQIKRYCHISNPDQDEKNGYYLPTNKTWWYKMEPLSSSLQASFQRYYLPSTEVSIDELMVRCFGRYVGIYFYFTPLFTPLFTYNS